MQVGLEGRRSSAPALTERRRVNLLIRPSHSVYGASSAERGR